MFLSCLIRPGEVSLVLLFVEVATNVVEFFFFLVAAAADVIVVLTVVWCVFFGYSVIRCCKV